MRATAVEQAAPEARVRISVTGLGWLKNRDVQASLERLLGEERGAVMDANAIEDAVFLLVSGLTDDGFLTPILQARITTTKGEALEYTFDASLSTLLPRPLAARGVDFVIERGVRSKVDEVAVSGLSVMSVDEAIGFFKPRDTLWQRDSTRIYSPARLRRSTDNLQDELRIRGYNEATAQSRVENADPKSGENDIVVDITEGPKWVVSTLTLKGGEAAGVTLEKERWENQAWTTLWQQDVAEELRRSLYIKGYPDARVRFQRTPAEPKDGARAVAVVAEVESGQPARVGQLRFEGNEHTIDSVLTRRVRLQPGEPLNPLRVDRARYRISRLGVFSSVKVSYEPLDAEVRDVVFSVTELPRWETSLLLGYGSYEQLRGGVEWRQSNLFGRAHQSRLQLVQSLKSTRAEYLYTVPELFGETLDGSARLFGLRREEKAFLREEYGANVSLRRRLGGRRGVEMRLGYTYQALRNQDNELNTREVDDQLVKVGSVEFGATLDRRDSPLRPRRGYRWFAQAEAASKVLAGEVDYQIYEAGAAYHTSWGRSRWIHASLTHGFITTLGSEDDRSLPVNKRFFPGGESDIRGFQRGEAAPVGADGRFIGAKSQMTANLELEQGLTGNWSGVLFVDALGIATSLRDYPFNERLYSVGLGARYQTLVGPIRVEYGRNLNPRVTDPSGTLHISVGFPF